MINNKARFRITVSTAMIAAALALAPSPAAAQTTTYQIRDMSLSRALREFGRISGRQIIYTEDLVRGRRAPELRGAFTPEAALERLLEGSGLRSETTPTGAIMILRASPVPGEAEAGGAAADSGSADAGATPEILVVGQRSINTDIRRTENDVQPYVVFDGDSVRESNATTLEDFFRTRVPMNTVQTTQTQNAGNITGNFSTINLRGLGTNQTLILIDGRRVPGLSISGQFFQPDINGIPLSAIERVEVLPTTASAIYGGGATGGVINIITRRDSGLDLSLTYGSSTRGDAQNFRLDGSFGLRLLDGRLNLLIAGSHATADPILSLDRDFLARGRALQFRNNPAAYVSLTIPPYGGTTNIRSSNGSNLVLDNGTPLNSPITFVPVGYAGPTSDGGAALVANAGRYNLDVPLDLGNGLRGLIYGSEQNSAVLGLRHEFSDRISAFADWSWQQNKGLLYVSSPQGNATIPAALNPFTTPIVVRFPTLALPLIPARSRTETMRAIGGAIVRLPENWSAEASYGWTRSRYRASNTSFPTGDPDGSGPGLSPANAAANGTLNVLRDLDLFPIDWTPYLLPTPGNFAGPSTTTMHNASLRMSGPVVHLPGGDATVTGLAEWRREASSLYKSGGLTQSAAFNGTVYPPRIQAVWSFYAEGRLPLVSRQNALPMVRDLELQLSARHDRYRTTAPTPASFATTSPDQAVPSWTESANRVAETTWLVGLRYVPVDGLTLRVSYGTGFLPPSISQITPTVQTNVVLNLADPRRGNQLVSTPPFTRIIGGNPDLVPETSKSWSIGAIIAPSFLEGLRISLDYTNIRKRDEIVANQDVSVFLNLESLLPDRVTRLPLTAADAALGYTGGVITQIDARAINVASTRVDAYDAQIDYSFATRSAGRFRAYLVATYQPTLLRQTLPNTDPVEQADYNNGVLRWRGNAGLNWDFGPWSAGWNAQYFHSYFVYAPGSNAATIAAATLNQGSARVPSQIYHDIVLTYRFGPRYRWLDGTRISLGVQNLFDKSPPILATTGTFGGYSTYGDPRLQRFTITLGRSF